MKKPFKNTILGKFLHGIIREIPLVGGIVDHVQSPAAADGGAKGQIDAATLSGQLVAAAAVILPILKTLGILPPWVHELLLKIIENIQL